MHNGYRWIYDNGIFWIADETDYFAVYENAKHVASFKDKATAIQYCDWRTNWYANEL